MPVNRGKKAAAKVGLRSRAPTPDMEIKNPLKRDRSQTRPMRALGKAPRPKKQDT
jgi:hypothetical protein